MITDDTNFVARFARHRPPDDEHSKCFALARSCFTFVAHELGRLDRETAIEVINEVRELRTRFELGASAELDAFVDSLRDTHGATRLVVLPETNARPQGGCDDCDTTACPRSGKAAAA